MKASIPAKLLRIRTFGRLDLSTFKDLISPSDYKACEKSKEIRPTWYNLTADVFVKFLYKVCIMHSVFPVFQLNFHSDCFCLQCLPLQRDISAQADLAVRQYRETTPIAERNATDIWNVMTKAQERTIKSIRSRTFEKYISVAHPDNGDDFFQEVSFSFCS